MTDLTDRRHTQLMRAVRTHLEHLDTVVVRDSGDHLSFRADRTFAWAWPTDRGVTLAFSLDRAQADTRIVHAIETHPGRWTLQVELVGEADLDGVVDGWLREAYADAAAREPNAPARRSTASQSVKS